MTHTPNNLTHHFTYLLENNEATIKMGQLIAQIIDNDVKKGIIVYLHGDLGAGKTTLTRGVVQGLGHKGNVKSPTYTLVEPYELPHWNVYHFDLYRLSDPEELEFMGIRDYFAENTCSFIEWPEKGQDFLPKADLQITIEYADTQRKIVFEAETKIAQSLLTHLSKICA